jgi:Uma2 family endonuclease
MIQQTKNEITTAEQLFQAPDIGNRLELVRGVLIVMSPAGSEHGWIASRILIRLGTHVEANDLGKTFAAETGFLIEVNPDTVRAPDAAFVSHERLATAPPSSSYLQVAPDLVVEVVSPNDKSTDVESKAEQWLEAGSSIVLVADPKNQTIRVYKSKAQIEVFHSGEEFSSGDVCGDWKISVNEIFDIQN